MLAEQPMVTATPGDRPPALGWIFSSGVDEWMKLRRLSAVLVVAFLLQSWLWRDLRAHFGFVLPEFLPLVDRNAGGHVLLVPAFWFVGWLRSNTRGALFLRPLDRVLRWGWLPWLPTGFRSLRDFTGISVETDAVQESAMVNGRRIRSTRLVYTLALHLPPSGNVVPMWPIASAGQGEELRDAAQVFTAMASPPAASAPRVIAAVARDLGAARRLALFNLALLCLVLTPRWYRPTATVFGAICCLTCAWGLVSLSREFPVACLRLLWGERLLARLRGAPAASALRGWGEALGAVCVFVAAVGVAAYPHGLPEARSEFDRDVPVARPAATPSPRPAAPTGTDVAAAAPRRSLVVGRPPAEPGTFVHEDEAGGHWRCDEGSHTFRGLTLQGWSLRMAGRCQLRCEGCSLSSLEGRPPDLVTISERARLELVGGTLRGSDALTVMGRGRAVLEDVQLEGEDHALFVMDSGRVSLRGGTQVGERRVIDRGRISDDRRTRD